MMFCFFFFGGGGGDVSSFRSLIVTLSDSPELYQHGTHVRLSRITRMPSRAARVPKVLSS